MPLQWEVSEYSTEKWNALTGEIEFGFVVAMRRRTKSGDEIEYWRWETPWPGTDKRDYSFTEAQMHKMNPDGLRFYRGGAPTMEEAKAALELKFQEWLVDAGLFDLDDEERKAVEGIRAGRAASG
jgi:hypothetical protein